MENFDIEKVKCPLCDGFLNGTFTVGKENHKPKSDDISICGHCGGILQFNEDLTFRPIDSDIWLNMKSESPDNYNKVIESVIVIKAKTQSMDEIYEYLKSI